MLRWIVTISWVLAGWRFYRLNLRYLVIVCVPLAVLFNPLAPIYMKKWQWRPYDEWTAIASVVAAVALLWAISRYRNKVS